MPNPFEQAMGGWDATSAAIPEDRPLTTKEAFADPITRYAMECLLPNYILDDYINGKPMDQTQSAMVKAALEQVAEIKKKAEAIAGFLTPDMVAILTRRAGSGSVLESLTSQIGPDGVSKLLSLNTLVRLALQNPGLFAALERLQTQYQKAVKTGDAISKNIQILSQHWGIPVTELEAVLSQPAANREAALEALIKKYNKGWGAGLVSLGLSQKPDLRAFMRAYASQVNIDTGSVGLDMSAAIGQLEPVIDFGPLAAAANPDLYGRVSDYLVTGDTSVLNKPEQTEYGFAMEALNGLDEFCGPKSQELGNRLRAFRRQCAENDNALAGLPANANDFQIRTRIAEWWAGRHVPAGGTAVTQAYRERMITSFIDGVPSAPGYLDFILDRKGVSAANYWRATITPILRQKILDQPPRGFDLLRIASSPELSVTK